MLRLEKSCTHSNPTAPTRCKGQIKFVVNMSNLPRVRSLYMSSIWCLRFHDVRSGHTFLNGHWYCLAYDADNISTIRLPIDSLDSGIPKCFPSFLWRWDTNTILLLNTIVAKLGQFEGTWGRWKMSHIWCCFQGTIPKSSSLTGMARMETAKLIQMCSSHKNGKLCCQSCEQLRAVIWDELST